MVIIKAYGCEWRCCWIWALVEPQLRYLNLPQSQERGERVACLDEDLLSYSLRLEYRRQLLAELQEPDRPNAYWDAIEEYRHMRDE